MFGRPLRFIFGEYSDEVALALGAAIFIFYLVGRKNYREWKLYKMIRSKMAKKSEEVAKEEMLFPPGPPSNAFPDLPPEESEEK